MTPPSSEDLTSLDATVNSSAISSRNEGFLFVQRSVLSLLSGVLLFLADYPVHAWPLLFVALLPWLWIPHAELRIPHAAWYGWTVGLAYTVGLATQTKLPIVMSVGLVLVLSLPWSLLGALLPWLSRGSAMSSVSASASASASASWLALGAGAIAVILEWLKAEVLSVWGTASCFARPLSEISALTGLLPWTGILGPVFVLVSTQVLLVTIVRERSKPGRIRRALLLGGLFFLLFLPAVPRAFHTPTRTLRVATVGWDEARLRPHSVIDAEGFLRDEMAPHVREAASQGAHLVIFPEAAYTVHRVSRPRVLSLLTDLARDNHVVLVVGFFDHEANQNDVLFVGPDGALGPDYHKTHLIFGMEKYASGDGTPVVVDIEGIRVGAMICQDDNFTDLARRYGREHTQLVVIPSNDWVYIKSYHFSNSLLRPVENGYAMVRAVSHGISAAMSSQGDLLATHDHTGQGQSVVVTDVPIPAPSGTLYSHAGNWLLVPAVAFLGILYIQRRRSTTNLASPLSRDASERSG